MDHCIDPIQQSFIYLSMSFYMFEEMSWKVQFIMTIPHFMCFLNRFSQRFKGAYNSATGGIGHTEYMVGFVYFSLMRYFLGESLFNGVFFQLEIFQDLLIQFSLVNIFIGMNFAICFRCIINGIICFIYLNPKENLILC